MVHALELIHGLLKNDGLLIDIHPQAVPSIIELHQNGKIEIVGYFDVPQWRVDFTEADRALAEAIKNGTFLLEQNGHFDTLTYYESTSEMRNELNASIERYARENESTEGLERQPAELAEMAKVMIRAAGENVKLARREKNHISRMKPSKN